MPTIPDKTQITGQSKLPAECSKISKPKEKTITKKTPEEKLTRSPMFFSTKSRIVFQAKTTPSKEANMMIKDAIIISITSLFYLIYLDFNMGVLKGWCGG